MSVKIRSTARLTVECDTCGSTLAVAETDGTWRAELAMGSETARDAARHGLLCGKTPEQLQRLSDALGVVKTAIAAGSGVTG